MTWQENARASQAYLLLTSGGVCRSLGVDYGYLAESRKCKGVGFKKGGLVIFQGGLSIDRACFSKFLHVDDISLLVIVNVRRLRCYV